MLFKKWFDELTMKHTDKVPSVRTSEVWNGLRKPKERKPTVRIDTARIMDEVMAEVRRSFSADRREKKSKIDVRSIIKEVKKEMEKGGSES